MSNILLAVNWLDGDLWFALPIIIALSLVYAATRHEETAPILRHALSFGFSVLLVVGVIFAVIMAISWWV